MSEPAIMAPPAVVYQAGAPAYAASGSSKRSASASGSEPVASAWP